MSLRRGNISNILLTFSLVTLCGCYSLLAEEPYYRRREEKVRKDLDVKYPTMDREKKEMIINRQIAIGFTKEEIRMAWVSPPDKIQSTNLYGADEVWIKHYSYGDVVLYFKNGVLIRIE